MNISNLLGFKKQFSEYVSQFYNDDPENNKIIRLKEKHTLKVCKNIIRLGKSINMSESDLFLAEASALFHDFGRFKQYRDYGTFNDRISVNHARLGLQQVSLNKILNILNREEKRLVSNSIVWHNSYELPEITNKKMLLFMKLLRDADKLDIWKVMEKYYRESENNPNPVIQVGLPNKKSYSAKIIQSIQNQTIAKADDLNSLNDFKLLHISWVFDLTFRESFKMVVENRYLEKIEQMLPNRDDIKTAVSVAGKYVEKKALSSSSSIGFVLNPER